MTQRTIIAGIVLLLSMSFVWGGFSSSAFQESLTPQQNPLQQKKAANQDASGQTPDRLQIVIKTYTLEHIKPDELLRATKFYYEDASFVDNLVTLRIWNNRVPAFEEMLAKLDVERKTVQFQVFAVIASRLQDVKRKLKEGIEESVTQKGGKGTEQRVSLKFTDTNLRDIVRYMAELAGLNVVFDAAVKGVVTCDLNEVTWMQALDLILKQNKMDKAIEGNVLWIAPIGRLGRVRSSSTHETLENKDLKKVLDELNSLWNFSTYEVDGPSFLTLRETSGPNSFKLVTNRPLNLQVTNVKVRGTEIGKRTIFIEHLKLSGMANFVDYVFIDTHDVVIDEKGYLVAGVSGYGSSSHQALILVLNAEIK